jgi:hypothetical protein
MNRIATRTLTTETFNRLVQGHNLLHEKLAGLVPPSALAMFVAPTLNEHRQVQWNSYLSGKPLAYADLSQDKAQALLERLTTRAKVLLDAIARFKAEGKLDDSAATRLTSMISHIPTDGIISVNDEPLVLFWRDALAAQEISARTFLTPVIPAKDTVPETLAHTANTGGGERRCSMICLWWMFGLILLLVLTALLWWLYCPLSPRNGISLAQDPNDKLSQEDFVISVPPSTPINPLELWQPIPIPAAPPIQCPKPVTCPVCPACAQAQTSATPAAPVQAKQKTSPPRTAQKKPVTITNAKEFCPGERPPELAPEIAVVFDHSGSMHLNINTTAAQEQQLANEHPASQLLRLLTGQPDQRIDRLTREPRRITVAKQAVSQLVQKLPSDMHTGLVTVGDCPTASNRGFFGPEQRQGFLTEIARTNPAGGTPLANGILQAGSMLDGINRQSMILVVTDGRESCGSDPCAAAYSLAAQKPHLTINVVDIGNSGAGNCVAKAGRGKVFTANSVQDLRLSVEQATTDLRGPKDCK